MGDNFPADPAHFCPPAPSERGQQMADGEGDPTGERIGALVFWIWRITPFGAPLVPILHVPHAPGPGCVPFIAQSVSVAARPPAWPQGKRDETIRVAVPAGLKRPRREQATRPREGHARWRMEAAYFSDLWGEDEKQVADRLDLAVDAGADEHKRAPRSRSARRYVGEGRRLLAALGAWPWCMDEHGRLESRWWSRQRYAEALARWHFDAFADAYDDLLRPVQYVAGARPAWRAVDYGAAVRLYREQFSELAARVA